jgi:hypothetical protein
MWRKIEGAEWTYAWLHITRDFVQSREQITCFINLRKHAPEKDNLRIVRVKSAALSIIFGWRTIMTLMKPWDV